MSSSSIDTKKLRSGSAEPIAHRGLLVAVFGCGRGTSRQDS
jgi:hypothetical protein